MELVTAAIAGALGAAGSIALLIRYVTRKVVDQAFSRFEGIVRERLELQAEVTRDYTKAQVGVYPALSELVYRAKAGADKVRDAGTTIEVINDEVTLACRELTEQLYRVRIYLPADVFEDLHRFKHRLQDLIMIGDFLTRPTPGNTIRELSPEHRERVRELCDDVATLCDSILARIEAHIASLQGPLRTKG